MYEPFFQMNRRPFRATAQVADYFPGAAIERARRALARCVERAEGAGLVIGPAGTGKTLLCLVLAEQFRDQLQVVHLTNGRYATPAALLQAILFELRRPFRKYAEGELRLSLIDHVTSADRCPNGLLLLVDEAHLLPPRQLEEIRMLTNLVRDGQPRVRIVLAGGPELEERLTNPKLEALNQRLAARCYLDAFTREETHQYIRSMLQAVTGDEDAVFSVEALDAVYAATDGIPRFVNQICDHALMLAFAGGHQELDKSGVEEAWSDLQQLPTPWHETEAGSHDDDHDERGIIEFGRLDEAHAESPAAESDAWETEFQPAGAIGPQADIPLDATEMIDPFGGEFDEEEILIDRISALETGQPLSSTQVDSQEGRELSERLEPFLVDAGPDLRVAAADDESSREVAAEPATVDGDDSVSAEPAAESEWFVAEADAQPDPSEFAETELAEDVAPESTDDSDLFTVEEDLEPVASVPLPTGGARHENYGQLFARLRRG